MKIRKRGNIPSIQVKPEDTITLIYRREIEFTNGHVESSERVVLEDRIERKMTIDEAVIFDVEKGDFDGAIDGIGGALLAHPE